LFRQAQAIIYLLLPALSIERIGRAVDDAHYHGLIKTQEATTTIKRKHSDSFRYF
jgi:hypothetical protein